MTALSPLETPLRVLPAESKTYPSNRVCAHPECKEKVQLRPDGTPTVHHCFPRGTIHSDSYFVQLSEGVVGDVVQPVGDPIPHAIGLCGSGTTGHHGDVEEHRGWIKLEDGVWNWYKRETSGDMTDEEVEGLIAGPEGLREWRLIGPLNPQPGSVEAKPKRAVHKGEAKRARGNWQIKVPADAENGAGILDDGFEDAYGLIAELEGLAPKDERTQYVCLADILEWCKQAVGEIKMLRKALREQS